jgi:hypothetical protein
MLRAVLWIAMLTLPAAQAGVVSFLDETFPDADWSTVVVQQDAGTSHTINGQIASGGNPGAYRQQTLSSLGLPGGTTAGVNIASFRNLFTFDPSANGAIQSLNFSYDLAFLASPTSTAGFFRPYIRQNGFIFGIAGVNNSAAGAWQTFQNTSTGASDWLEVTGSGSLPDFSASGGLIEFGYRTAVTFGCGLTTTCPPFDIVSGIDNYRVTVNFQDAGTAIPEPSTYALFGSALLAGALWRRRRIATDRDPGATGLGRG